MALRYTQGGRGRLGGVMLLTYHILLLPLQTEVRSILAWVHAKASRCRLASLMLYID